MEEKLYRPNAAAVIVNQEGLLLVCERAKEVHAWQFPQGGIDPGEDALQAVQREVWEEVGYLPEYYVIEKGRTGYRYDYPAEVLQHVREVRKQPYVGQEQTYFFCRLVPGAPEPVLDQREFKAYKWIRPEEFDLNWLPEFKREVYREVMDNFFFKPEEADQ
jgi:putative (di)nucleoside polyphosphate hydrolase